MSKTQTFEQKMELLEKSVALIENENTTIDDAIAEYEKAVKLSKECYDTLSKANGKIKELTKDIENTIVDLKEFDNGN